MLYRKLFTLLSLIVLLLPNGSNLQFGLTQDTAEITSLDWNSDGRIAVGFANGKVEITDRYGKVITTLDQISQENQTARVDHLSWNPRDNRLAVTKNSLDYSAIEIWDTTINQLLQVLKHRQFLRNAIWNSDGSMLAAISITGIASADADFIVVWDGKSGQLLKTFGGWMQGFSAIAWRPGNRSQLASVFNRVKPQYDDEGGDITLWDVTTGSSVVLLSTPSPSKVIDPKFFETLSWSPDGQQLGFSANDYAIRILDANTRKITSTFTIQPDLAFTLTWSADGFHLAYTTGYELHILSAITGKSEQCVKYPITTPEVDALAWNPAGTQIAYGGGSVGLTITDVFSNTGSSAQSCKRDN